MKIYFSAAIRGGRQHAGLYAHIVAVLKKHGEVLSSHVGDKKLPETGEVGLDDAYIYQRDMAWLREADAVVADVTVPSIGVGYEIASAEMLGKKMLCLYHEGAAHNISGMINGNGHLNVKTYASADDLAGIFEEFFG